MLAFAPSSSSSSSSSSPNYAYVPSPLSPRSANIYGVRRHQFQQSASSSSSSFSYNHMSTNEPPGKSTSRNGSNPRDDEENLPQPVAAAVTITNTTNSSSSSRIPFSQRPIKRPPFHHQLRAPFALQNGRRDAYLRKIALRRDEARFETRGEDMMRWDFMQRQRAWEAERAKEAALAASDYLVEDEEEEGEEEEEYEHDDEVVDGGYDEYDLPGASGQMNGLQRSSMANSATRSVSQEAEVEEFLREEGKELEALLEHLPPTGEEYGDDDAMNQEERNEFDETSLWSDDADYDALFEEVLSQQEQAGGNAAVAAAAQSSQVISDAQHGLVGGDDEMDMS